jgi:hypothetical protein
MATTPPRPPVSPVAPVPPVRPRSNVLPIVLLILAIVVVGSIVAFWAAFHFFSHAVHVNVKNEGSGKEEVSINTPVGSINVNKAGPSEASIGLPIYPGATRIKDSDSANINMDFGPKSVHVAVAKYQSTDPASKVVAFYQNALGSQITTFKEADSEGKTVFEIKHAGQEKVVTVQETGGHTRIELVSVGNVGESPVN